MSNFRKLLNQAFMVLCVLDRSRIEQSKDGIDLNQVAYDV